MGRPLLAILTACVLQGSNCSSDVKLTLTPKYPLNGDSTVHIRVYQLKDQSQFLKADFEELWNEPKKALKGDLIGEGPLKEDDVLPPKPNQKEPTKIKYTWKEEQLDPQTVYFGVAALFTPSPAPDDKSKWKTTVLRKEAGSFVFVMGGKEKDEGEYKILLKED